MDPVHFDKFVSCEDDVGKPKLFGVYSIHNVVCSVTSIILMALPYRAYLSAKRYSSTHSKAAAGMIGNDDDMERINKKLLPLKPEVIAYLLALTHLFYVNLHQHIFGSFYFDLDSGGAFHSIFLSLMVYEQCKYTLHDRLGIPILNTGITRTLTTIATLIEFTTPLFSGGRKVAATVGNIAALTVVPFMGYLSWIQRHADKSRAFLLWILSCLGVKAAEVLVRIEKSHICDNASIWILRLYHAIVIHGEIWFLFWAVSECAFSIMKCHGRGK